MIENFHTYEEAAATARVSVRTCINEVHRGHLKVRRFGRATRIAASDLADWLNAYQGRST
jgi:excisionase family DNA binding protein